MKRTVNSWEYQVLKVLPSDETIEDGLNFLGQKGWELVAITPSTGSWYLYVWKRFRGQIEIE